MTAIDIGLRASPSAWLAGGILLALAVLAGVHGSRASLATWHRASRGLIGLAFFGERLLWAGVEPVGMIAFLVLLMALASLQGLERTFGPVYASMDAGADHAGKVDAAAIGAYARALGLLGFTFAASLLLALFVPLAVLRESSLAAAVALSLGLLLVIGWLALSPAAPARKA